MTNLDGERVLENFQLCVNSALAIGCAIRARPEDLAAGNAKALDELAWNVVKTALRKRINVEYEDVRGKCAMCRQAIDGQHGEKGTLFICMDCLEYNPVNLVNFFTGENALETNEAKAKAAVDPKKKAVRQTLMY